MDQVDEFEMKPLTSGLGFQKRQVSLREHLIKSNLPAQNMRRSLPSLPPEELTTDKSLRSSKEIIDELHAALKPAEKSDVRHNDRAIANLVAHSGKSAMRFTEILPRDISDIRNPISTPEILPIENINFQIPNKTLTEGAGVRRGAHDNLPAKLVAVPVSLSSIILDAAVVFAVSLLFLVSLILVTRVDLISVLKSSQSEFATQLSMVVLYLSVYEMYVIITRSFFGWTVGEWTFDLQMGSDEQITKSSYPAMVLWRTLFSLVTGIIVLPLLSLIFGKDLAAQFTGLQLYKKNI